MVSHETDPGSDVDTPGRLSRTAFTYLIAVVSSIGGLLFGYDTGIISGALLFLKDDFALSTFQQEVVVSSILVGAAVGAMLSERLCDRYGRRVPLMAVAPIFIIGSLLSGASQSTEMIIGSRLFLGLALGGASQIVPVYISEIAPRRRRGFLVNIFELAVAFGILVSYLVGFLLQGGGNWRWMLWIGALPALVLWVGVLVVPESPRWLMKKGRLADARRVLVRTRTSSSEVELELDQTRKVLEQERGTRWSDLAKPWVRPAVIVGVGSGVVLQFVGTNAILYYAPTLLSSAGFGQSAALLSTAGTGIAFALGGLVGMLLVDRVGRRRLVLCALPGAAVSLAVLGVVSAAHLEHSGAQWLIPIGFIGYTAFDGAGIATVAWLLPAEVFPLSLRAKGMAVSAALIWISDIIVSSTALSLGTALGAGGLFFLYGGLNVLGWILFRRRLGETAGRNLEEIEMSLSEGGFSSLRLREREPRSG